MKKGVSHSFKEESLHAKAKWFMQLTVQQRFIEALEGIELVRALTIVELPDDRSLFKTVRILEQK